MADDWKTGLPPEIAAHPSMAGFQSVGDLAKSWVNAQGLIGAEKLVLPKDEKDEAGWAQVFAKLGRPELPTGYQVPELKELPEGFTVQEERVKSFLANAHKLGLSQRQAAGLLQAYVTEQAGIFTQQMTKGKEALTAAEQAMRAEWGAGYEAQLSLAKKTLAWAAGESDAKALIAEGFGNDPRIMKVLAKIGNALSEDVLGPGAPKPGDLTPEAARKEISAILTDTKHPYFVADHPEHKVAVERMTQLQELAHPGMLGEA